MMVGFDFDKSFVVNMLPLVSSIVKSGMDCDMATDENEKNSKATNNRFLQLRNFGSFNNGFILIFLCFLKL